MLKIRVPATTANIGPGFDSMGLALDLYNDYSFEVKDSGLSISGTSEELSGSDNLVYTSYVYALETIKKSDVSKELRNLAAGLIELGLKLHIDAKIPVCRGLGSSAACILAGVAAANELSDAKLTKEKVLEIANEIEGHPDNLAPALYGGFCISVVQGDQIVSQSVSLDKDLEFVALIPDFTMPTSESRKVIPERIDYKDAVFNVGRAGLLVAALCAKEHSKLKYACKDLLHQPYRLPLIESAAELMKKMDDEGAFASFISGAGPTLMSIVQNSEHFIGKIKTAVPKTWEIRSLSLDARGIEILK